MNDETVTVIFYVLIIVLLLLFSASFGYNYGVQKTVKECNDFVFKESYFSNLHYIPSSLQNTSVVHQPNDNQ